MFSDVPNVLRLPGHSFQGMEPPGNPMGPSHLNTKLGPKNERQAMLDADKHLMAAEYLVGTFYPTEDSPPTAMSHDQATALATTHALLAIAGLLREISTALASRG